METFSISDAAFTGFRIARERPRAVAVWAVLEFAVSLAFGGAVAAMAGPDLMRLQDTTAAAPTDPGAVIGVFQRLAPIYGLTLIFALAFNALLYAAMNRAVMRPVDDRFGYFRLGADELRQFALMLLTLAVIIGVYFAAAVVAVAIAALASLAFKPALGLIAVLIVLAAFCAEVFVVVRLSLASAQTFATGKVNLFGSWALTRGRFWPIFGTYVLAAAFAAVVLVLGFVVGFALIALGGGGDALAKLVRPDLGSVAAILSPAMLARTAVIAVITALVWPVVLTPPAAIYRRLTAGSASTPGAPT